MPGTADGDNMIVVMIHTIIIKKTNQMIKIPRAIRRGIFFILRFRHYVTRNGNPRAQISSLQARHRQHMQVSLFVTPCQRLSVSRLGAILELCKAFLPPGSFLRTFTSIHFLFVGITLLLFSFLFYSDFK